MKKNFKIELLKEELNKFKLLSEYGFYQETQQVPEFKDIILGSDSLAEADETPDDLKPEENIDAAADKIASDLGVDSEDMPDDMSDDMSGEIPEPTDEPVSEPTSDEVEVDVTSLVKGTEEAKTSADSANKNSEMLLQKLTDLESRIANMASITDKIEGLEKEIVKRNPTPVEKLEMRSLSSFPYSQKLTDYWSEKTGAYDVMDKEKEYVLTKDDVDADYSDTGIRKTFSVPDKGYDEETINDYDEENI